MIDHVDQLIVEQARIEGMTHGAVPHHPVPGFDVTDGIHRQRTDTGAHGYSVSHQNGRHLACALRQRCPVRPRDLPVGKTTDDLPTAVPSFRVNR